MPSYRPHVTVCNDIHCRPKLIIEYQRPQKTPVGSIPGVRNFAQGAGATLVPTTIAEAGHKDLHLVYLKDRVVNRTRFQRLRYHV